MKRFYLLFVMIAAVYTGAQDHQMHDMEGHNHEGHLHDTMVDGKLLEVNAERFDDFVLGLEGKQVAIVSVIGMVCDFCARGIEKTFSKDKTVLKLDVDLSGGKVLIAFDKDKNIDFEDIKKKILSNGQNATDLQIIKI
ncbi:MAG: cation transporter [Proteobacteria bacterium]|nr:cation transporter [Pseudomonadota bacterium]MDA0881185.1 cation transporter [Pseudomonadota bacterium]MDA1341955.1 cation transporter [Pseudomonadota bacterium]